MSNTFLENRTMPKYVGMYCIGGKSGFCIHSQKKPLWVHRLFMKLLLGWEWHNDTNL